MRKQRDERARLYRIDRVLVEGLKRAFAVADARADLLRGEPVERYPTGPRHRWKNVSPVPCRAGSA
ncbi:hypothetical protein [Streptomyces griseochromogenes]|uniref:hypothetical protein n=1 Tax=Streptomyces griseochromogenes TaxID=68214 RepID=UPI0037BA8ABD